MSSRSKQFTRDNEVSEVKWANVGSSASPGKSASASVVSDVNGVKDDQFRMLSHPIISRYVSRETIFRGQALGRR